MMDKVLFYRDNQDEWRWQRKDEGNHREVGAASEGYKRYRDAYDNAYSQFGDTVQYIKWPLDETGDPKEPQMEIKDGGAGSTAEE
jgi:uncharacterized protein YegP (UPF0339 family)